MKIHNKIAIVLGSDTAQTTRDRHYETENHLIDYPSNWQYIYVHLFDWLKRGQDYLLDRGQPNVIKRQTT